MPPIIRRATTFVVAIPIATAALCAAGQSPRRDGHGDAPLDEYNRALGVECSHCHVMDQWTDESLPAKAIARRMSEMVTLLNGKLLRGVGEVRCWTCHGGQVQPARLSQEALVAELARWPASLADAPENVKLTMAVYSASTGLRCTQCHAPDNWKRYETDKMRMVPRMTGLFSRIQPSMPPTAQTQCFMCHKGTNKPQKTP
jgi:hypothetical protein